MNHARQRQMLVSIVVLLGSGFVGCSTTGQVGQNQTPTTAPSPAPSAKPVAPPEKAAAQAAGEVRCKLESEERILRLHAKSPGCSLEYTKAGETKAIASSVHGTQHCEQVRDRIRKNLEAAGYSCK